MSQVSVGDKVYVAKVKKKERKIVSLTKRLVKSPFGLMGFLVILGVCIVGIFAPVIAPFNPVETDLTKKLLAPMTGGHLLGTDQLGRDILSRIIYGTRISLIIGITTVFFAGLVGTTVGVLAGYFRGWLDVVLMRIVDVQLSFPFILLVLIINAVLGTGLKNIMISLIVVGWVSYARVIRSEVLAIREKEFIHSCFATGVPRWEIIVKHIVPNLFTPLIVLASLQVSTFIIAEASVSFLGFGVQPPTPAWGNMLNEGKNFILSSWWLITFPGLALVITTLGINLFGDWLRDELDPEMNQNR
ncbi:peptide ABC transporter permease [Sporosarcina sp. P13]|uniref:ABC transporter permease n=1 Tax=Sporosarcina sp. P13 TaxID=2048263 RepID=UPI000C163716|nr:ABC transporter permease [Sporosarcina sp. P13]PIC63880.1 peptide ABC transporter permease [Sporosarcina sp. P13]